MIRAALVDYGAGNLRSLGRALEAAGAQVAVLSAPAGGAWDVVVLPGVGHFGAAVERLRQADLWDWVLDRSRAGVPLLGVCLGMQLLFEASEESPGVRGLGLLEGAVRRLPGTVKVPHMGWNVLRPARSGDLLRGLAGPVHVYYAHSYVAEPAADGDVVAVTDYGREFAAAVRRGAVLGVQFHPEKSGRAGIHILRNALHMLAGAGRAGGP
ncbi:MAG: imidazole glycerol phosphate synthase subunit HisH [Armatimonadota bacterium]|nr:imidazole glycerol phosphate synthase subunit HisH [Armatimonadota bacterium]MDR7401250.1 imidazole glycerol phosphate synthase subunit HisH [Armatimonadota bacterium]MDR7402991.1 imidazole glycerol phosphate synthase subunit HisH [Armatimonadota bacterium]MDR7437144.1 imidazole glycerol phosphate synthase subunit HisH [Armatimonadota bacterium]MDR7471896.1 imidazole glycerol phosphate synthase subunit HisH [Armatimonadota bacterium]